MDNRKKLEVAKEFIDMKNYVVARAILEALPQDHTANRWLAKLNEIEPRINPAPETNYEYLIAHIADDRCFSTLMFRIYQLTSVNDSADIPDIAFSLFNSELLNKMTVVLRDFIYGVNSETFSAGERTTFGNPSDLTKRCVYLLRQILTSDPIGRNTNIKIISELLVQKERIIKHTAAEIFRSISVHGVSKLVEYEWNPNYDLHRYVAETFSDEEIDLDDDDWYPDDE